MKEDQDHSSFYTWLHFTRYTSILGGYLEAEEKPFF